VQDDIDEINALIADVQSAGQPTADDFINLALMVRHMRELIEKALGKMKAKQKTTEPPTTEEILPCFAGSNFGAAYDPVEVVKEGILKAICGYWNGHTLTSILEELGLIKTSFRAGFEERITITERGRYSCWAWFRPGAKP
jgi:hypothetical protein